VEENELDEVLSVYEKRLVSEKGLAVGQVVRARRSVDPYYDWHVRRVRRSL
jgi:hypothetical protein